MANLWRVFKPGMLLGCALLFAASVPGGAATPQDTTGMPAPAATVEMHIHSFEPKSVTIQAGQAVLWKNTTFVVGHTVTADPKLAKNAEDVALPAGAEPFNSGTVSSAAPTSMCSAFREPIAISAFPMKPAAWWVKSSSSRPCIRKPSN